MPTGSLHVTNPPYGPVTSQNYWTVDMRGHFTGSSTKYSQPHMIKQKVETFLSFDNAMFEYGGCSISTHWNNF